MANTFTIKEKTSYPDVRIEIVMALLHNSVISTEAFHGITDLIAGQIDKDDGYTYDDNAWEDFKFQFDDPDYTPDDDDGGSPK